MPDALHQESHHGVALRRTPQTAALQGSLDSLGIHH
jgi:hypothetical protein